MLPSVDGWRLSSRSGRPTATLSPVSVNRTGPDAPSNDTSRIALSSAPLSTDPSAATPTLPIAMAAVHT
eukprot:3939512-Rhodomonas_salina.1